MPCLGISRLLFSKTVIMFGIQHSRIYQNAKFYPKPSWDKKCFEKDFENFWVVNLENFFNI